MPGLNVIKTNKLVVDLRNGKAMGDPVSIQGVSLAIVKD